MSSDRRILHLVPSEPWGGIQALVPMLLREQVAQGRDVRLICLGKGERIRAVARDYGLDGSASSISGVLAPLRLFFALRGARNAIVHTHCEPIWAAGVVSLSGTSRWIAHAHVYPDNRLTWKKRLSRRLQRLAARHIAISHSVGRSVVASDIARNDRVDVVYNGIAAASGPSFPARRNGKVFTLGFIGRVVEEKGIFDFLTLAAELASDPRVAFAVYGDGADIEKARARAAALDIADRVIFHGYLEDIAVAWTSLDMVAIFSHREPFGLVFLEAVQHGVPSVSYANDSGGSEVAAMLQSAYQVAPGDITAASRLIREALDTDRSAEADLASDRATIMQHFDIAVMARGIDAVYRRLGNTHPTDSVRGASGAVS